MSSNNIKSTVKLAIIIGLICFIFPFVTVSCSGDGVKLRGAELMLAWSFEEQDELSLVDEARPNFYLWAAFGLGIASIVLMAKAREEDQFNLRAAGTAAAGGALLLVLFRSSFERFYGLTDYRESISVQFEWGWELAFFVYLVAAAASFYGIAVERREQAAIHSPPIAAPSIPVGEKFLNHRCISQALALTADDDMADYLTRILPELAAEEQALVKAVLQLPREQIRGRVKILYALAFTTDDGMVDYLTGILPELAAEEQAGLRDIIFLPKHMVRSRVADFVVQ